MTAADSVFSDRGRPGVEAMGLLASPERRIASLYLLPLLEEFQESNALRAGADEPLDWSSAGGFRAFEYGGKTMVLPEGYTITADGSTIELDGYCFRADGGSRDCLNGEKWFRELGLDRLGIVVVREDGGWVVSVFETTGIVFDTALMRYLELRDAGELHLLER